VRLYEDKNKVVIRRKREGVWRAHVSPCVNGYGKCTLCSQS